MTELQILREQISQLVQRYAGGLVAELACDDSDLEQLRKRLRTAREIVRECRLLAEELAKLEQLRLPLEVEHEIQD